MCMVLFPVVPSQAGELPTLEEQLSAHADQVISWLKDRNVKRAGVLKFRVAKPGEAVTDNAGPINRRLADQLETALVLHLSEKDVQEIEVVRDASDVAKATPGSSHLDESGRERLFSANYPRAWGQGDAQVDAFVTGVIQLADDLESMRVALLAVMPESVGLVPVAPTFFAKTNGALLNELGESFQRSTAQFHLRGDRDEFVSAAQLAANVRNKPGERYPLIDQPSVELRIYYDDRPVEIEIIDGMAFIPEPQEGQRVTLELERMDSGDLALGAVLKLNGENTKFRQRLRDYECAKYLLLPQADPPKPGMPGYPMKIKGFQLDGNQAEAFRVASGRESQDLEMDYGRDVGTISLVVFAEQGDVATKDFVDASVPRPEALAIRSANFPDDQPESLAALKRHLIVSSGGDNSRGVIVPGAPLEQPVEHYDVSFAPEPILSAVIRYYDPDQSE
ncbi:MAG: hypothetical protein RJP95_03825 [Pirellulales bacterium]